MSLLGLIPTSVWVGSAILLAFALLIWLLIRNASKLGAADEKLEQRKEVNEALRRASDVQAEHRDASDTERRLRDGGF